jgi:SAM-dependent methyltransferase
LEQRAVLIAVTDPLRARYDAIPYRHGAVPLSHPARIGAIARLFAWPAAPPDHCRVLELGCGEGMNLLPLAERLPQSEFVGVDLSAAQIAVANEARAVCLIQNARFICADLREFEPETFDYVIAHGVYSWVPDDVKDRLLAICSRALAPGGVAYVSFSTLPGWAMLSGLRAFLIAETRHETAPAAQLELTQRILETISRCLAQQPGSYAGMVREAVDDMLGKAPAVLFHDELGTVNDPCTFLDFTAHAARHGLHYLGEAHYASMPFEHVPAPMRSALAELNLDFFHVQQFMDVLFQRWLRSSLLVRSEPATRTADPIALRECALGLRWEIEGGRVDLAPGVPLRLTGPNGVALDFHRPLEKAFLAGLVEAWPDRVAFSDALERAHQLLQRVALPTPDDDGNLRRELQRLFSIDGLDVLFIGQGQWLRTGPAPAPSRLMRYQACGGFALTNRWHEQIELRPEGRVVLADPAPPQNEFALRQAGLLI